MVKNVKLMSANDAIVKLDNNPIYQGQQEVQALEIHLVLEVLMIFLEQ